MVDLSIVMLVITRGYPGWCSPEKVVEHTEHTLVKTCKHILYWILQRL